MPREIRVFTMSVLDMLTCALAATVLISLLLIVSTVSSSKGGFPYRYFTATAGVWIDVQADVDAEAPASLKSRENPGGLTDFEQSDISVIQFEQKLKDHYKVDLEVHWHRLKSDSEDSYPFTTKEGVNPQSHCSLSTSEQGVSEFREQPTAQLICDTGTVSSFGLRAIRNPDPQKQNKIKWYLAYRLNVAAFSIQPGWYFFKVQFSKGTHQNKSIHVEAWIQIESSGSPNAIWLQTCDKFEDELWPNAQTNQLAITLQERLLKVQGEKEKLHSRMQQSHLPDIFSPTWPKDYPPGITNKSDTEFVLVDNIVPKFFAIQVDSERSVPPAARFPVLGNILQQSPGWHIPPANRRKQSLEYFVPGVKISQGGATQ